MILGIGTGHELGEEKRKRILIYITIAVSIIVFVQVVFFLVEKGRISSQARKTVENESRRAAESLERKFTKLMMDTTRFADKLSSGDIKKRNLFHEIKRVITMNPSAYGFGVAYNPFEYSPSTRLYAPYFVRVEDNLEFRPIEAVYDYSVRAEHSKWFYMPVTWNRGDWKEPHFGKASGTRLAGFSVPFYNSDDTKKEQPIGAVFTSYSLGGLSELMESLELGKTGYGYLLSKKGTFLSHPISEYVKQEKEIGQLARELKNKKLQAFANNFESQESGIMAIENEVTGQTSLMCYQRIPSTGWMVVVLFVEESIKANIDSLRVQIIWILLSVIILLSLVFTLKSKAYIGTNRSLWKLSTVFSLLLCIGITGIWAISLHWTGTKNSTGTVIVDQAGLSEFKRNYPDESAVYIPTGVFIQSLEFTSANNVKLTGYIWQKYHIDDHMKISRGFVMPEAIEANVTEAFVRMEGKILTMGWYFESNLRQTFDYSRFPLDEKDVWIRLWHKDFDKNVILVPDLASYKLRNPGSKPGIEKDIVLSGLEIRSSFFSYVPKSYNTNFGIDKYVGEDNFPELYYTVVVRRNFMDPFISHLLPFLAIAGIIFSLFLIITDSYEMAKKFDYSCTFILGAAAGLIFSVLVAHSQLRSSIRVNEIIYLEYFYIVLYIMILLLTIDSFLFSMDFKIKILNFRGNLLPKLFYWPTVLGTLLIITVFVFI
jgi:Cache domain